MNIRKSTKITKPDLNKKWTFYFKNYGFSNRAAEM